MEKFVLKIVGVVLLFVNNIFWAAVFQNIALSGIAVVFNFLIVLYCLNAARDTEEEANEATEQDAEHPKV